MSSYKLESTLSRHILYCVGYKYTLIGQYNTVNSYVKSNINNNPGFVVGMCFKLSLVNSIFIDVSSSTVQILEKLYILDILDIINQCNDSAFLKII